MGVQVLQLRFMATLCLYLAMLGHASTAMSDPIDYALLARDVPEAYLDAAALHGVPPAILFAVALTEAADYQYEFVQRDVGRRAWPWTLNVAGRPYRFASREEACIALQAHLKSTSIIDVGIAQLNIRWNPELFEGSGRFGRHPCDALNPYANLEEAARLLQQHYASTGDWLLAAGRYHRPAGGEPAARYRDSVEQELLRLWQQHITLSMSH